MLLFDCNSCFGVDIVNHECVNHENFIVLEKVNAAANATELIENMDHVEIKKALVWHRTQYELDATAGNERVVQSIKGFEDRLFPSWTILPSITDEQFNPESFFQSMKKHNVKALRAYPAQNRYILCRITMGEQLDLLSNLKIPLFISPANGYESIYQIMQEFPQLTVILANIGWWPSARFIYPLMKHYPNLYFETGDFSMIKGIEEVCDKFGSERLLFGTNFPTNCMAGSVYTLMKAHISDEDRENIAHRNLERLLSGVIL